MLSAYGFMFITIRKYGAETWGLFSLATTFCLILAQVSKFGADSTFLVLISEEDPSHRTHLHQVFFYFLKRVFILCALSSLILYLTSSLIAESIFRNAELGNYLKAVSFIIFPISFLLVISEGMKGLGAKITYVLLQNTSIYLFALLGMIPFWLFTLKGLEGDYIPLLSYATTTYLLLLCGFYIYYVKTNRTVFAKNILPLSPPFIARINRMSRHFFYTQIFIVIIGWIDTILLGAYMTEKIVGLYNIALRFSFLVFMPLMTVAAIISPKISSFFKNSDLSSLTKLLKNSYQITLLLTFCMLLFIVFFSKFIVEQMGIQYSDIKIPMYLLCAGQVINVLFGPNDTLLQMIGHETVFMKSIGIAMVANIVLDLILIPHFGMIGAALGNVVGLIIWNLLCTKYLRTKLQISSIAI